MPTQSLRTLLTGLIDYAGLFPPAKLGMGDAATEYARQLMGPHAPALGRFICPVSRFEQLSRDGAIVMPGTYATSGYQEMADASDPWSVSALIDGELEAGLDMVDAFNDHHADAAHGRARIDAIELRVRTPTEIDTVLDTVPEDIAIAIEFPAEAVQQRGDWPGDPRGFIAALSGSNAAAKIRCGGVTPDAFPSPADVARFLAACHAGGVSFKATAGLHHPVRAEHRLTYEPAPPRGVMHGFLNVFLGAALLHAGKIDPATLEKLLGDTDPKSFAFTDEHASWQGRTIPTAQIARARESFCLSYGSCSFAEPLDDLAALGLL
jgi:hypothetical protein